MKLGPYAESILKGVKVASETAMAVKGIYDTTKYLYGAAQAAGPVLGAMAAVL